MFLPYSALITLSNKHPRNGADSRGAKEEACYTWNERNVEIQQKLDEGELAQNQRERYDVGNTFKSL